MIIKDNLTLKDIQREFSTKFPNLKIAFFSVSHSEGEGSPKDAEIDPEARLDEVRTVHDEGNLEITPEMTVAELEKLFLDTFGLNVQVMRQSGNLWMQTTATDDWTLERQNRKGGSSKVHYDEKYQ